MGSYGGGERGRSMAGAAPQGRTSKRGLNPSFSTACPSLPPPQGTPARNCLAGAKKPGWQAEVGWGESDLGVGMLTGLCLSRGQVPDRGCPSDPKENPGCGPVQPGKAFLPQPETCWLEHGYPHFGRAKPWQRLLLQWGVEKKSLAGSPPPPPSFVPRQIGAGVLCELGRGM